MPVAIPAHVTRRARVVVVAGRAGRQEEGDSTASGETLIDPAVTRPVGVATRSAGHGGSHAAPGHIAAVERAHVVVVAQGAVRDMPARLGVVDTDVLRAREAIIAVFRGSADAVSTAADIVHRAEIAVAARSCCVAPRAGAGRWIAGVDGAGVAVVTRDRRVRALPGGRVACVAGAEIAVIAVLRDALANHPARGGRDADLARGAETAVVARRPGRQLSLWNAPTRFVAHIGSGARVVVVAAAAGRLDLADARPRPVADVAGRAGQTVAARRPRCLVGVTAASKLGIEREDEAGIRGAGIAVIAAQRVVPAGSRRGVAGIDRAPIEVVTRRTLEGRHRSRLRGRERTGGSDGENEQTRENHERARASATDGFGCHATFPLPPAHDRRSENVEALEGSS